MVKTDFYGMDGGYYFVKRKGSVSPLKQPSEYKILHSSKIFETKQEAKKFAKKWKL
jgi:hypothetical protein